MDNPNKWPKRFYKKTAIDAVFDLIDDTWIYLKRSKHIQNVRNFFNKFKINKYQSFDRYTRLKKPDAFTEIVLNEIKEIKMVKENKKKTITPKTEPSVQDVIEALKFEDKINYAELITNIIVEIFLTIGIIVIGIAEAIRFIIKKFIALPFREALRVSIIIILIGGSLSIATAVYLNFRGMILVKEQQAEENAKMRKLIDDDYNELKNLANENRDEMSWLKAHATIIKHERTYTEATIANGKDRGKKIIIERKR